MIVKRLMVGLLAVLAVGALVFVWMLNTRVDLSAFDSLYAPRAEDGVSVQFFGTSSLLFADADTRIMIDGWFSRPSTVSILFGEIAPDLEAIDAGLARLGDRDVDALIPVHTHLDHAMDVAEVAKRTGALLVGSDSAANIGRGGGLPESQIRVVTDGDTLRFGDFTVTMIETGHFLSPNPLFRETDVLIEDTLSPPASGWAYRQGTVFSVLIEHPEGSALIHASPGLKEGAFADIDVDTLHLGIGGLASQTTDYQAALWREAVSLPKPEGLYLIHWDDFEHSPMSIDPGDPPGALNLFWDGVFGMKSKAGIEAVLTRAKAEGVHVALLPMWTPVDAFHVAGHSFGE